MDKHNPTPVPTYKVKDKVLADMGLEKVEATIVEIDWDHNEYCWCYRLGEPAKEKMWYTEEELCEVKKDEGGGLEEEGRQELGIEGGQP